MAIGIGPHSVEIEGDIITVRLRGDFELAHMQQWCGLADKVIAEYGGAFTISDFSTGGHFPPESRRYGSQWPNAGKVWGSALVGSSLALRVLMTMIIRVSAVLRKQQGVPLISVATEAEARAWVATQRTRLGLPQAPSSPSGPPLAAADRPGPSGAG